MTYPTVYNKATHCAPNTMPGTLAIMQWALNTWPTASNLGTLVCRRVRGRRQLSQHATGRAGDIGYPASRTGHPDGWAAANTLLNYSEEFGIQYLIYNRQQWNNQDPTKTWRRYRGAHNHDDHIHYELTIAAGNRLTRDQIDVVLGGLPTTVRHDDEAMTSFNVRLAAAKAEIRDTYWTVAGRAPDKTGERFWYDRVEAAVRADVAADDELDTQTRIVVRALALKLEENLKAGIE